MVSISLLNKTSEGQVVESQLTVITEQSVTIPLTDKDIAKLGISPDQINLIEQQGNNAIIYLKDGTKIILENFFNQQNPQFVLADGQTLWSGHAIVDSSTGKVTIHYSNLHDLNNLYTATSWAWIAGGVAAGIAVIANNFNDDSSTPKDTTAPLAAQNNTFSNQGKTITGSAEAGSLITIKDATGKILATTTATSSGKYSVELPNALTNGETITIIVTDKAGNSSVVATLTADDTTAPTSGTLSLSNFTDTGTSSSDNISQDNNLDLTLSGQETGSTVSYQISNDGGKTWTDTTAKQNNLVDGDYQFKAIVKDLAGNISETNTQKVTIDSSIPVAGSLSLSNFSDTGTSSSDNLSQDNNFDLTLIGQETGSTVSYQMSIDGGKTWTDTTAKQSSLADGDYQFKAIVKDLAGNTSETNSLKITIDNTLVVSSDIANVQNLTAIKLTDKDQTLSINLQLSDLPTDTVSSLTTVQTEIDGTTYSFTYNTSTGLWSAKIPTNVLWSDQNSNSLTLDLNVTDQAGNTTHIQHSHTFTINHTPTTPTIDVAIISLGPAIFEETAYKGSTVELYNSNNELIGSAIADENGYFRIESSKASLDDKVYATSSLDGHISTASENTTVISAPFLLLTNPINSDGEITGYISTGSTLLVLDQDGNTIQEFPNINNPDYYFESISYLAVKLDTPLPEGTKITIIAIKDGVYSDKFKLTTDYTAPEAPTDLAISEDGTTLTGIAEPSSFIEIYNEDGDQASGYTDSNGIFSINIEGFYRSNETLTILATDKAGNTSPKAATIITPVDTIPPRPITNITLDEDGRHFTAKAEANSYIEVTDENGNTIGYGYTDSEGQVDYGYFYYTFLKGQQLNFVVIDRENNVSSPVTINALVDNTPPAPITNIILDENGRNFTAQAEAYSRIEVTDENGNIIGSGNTDSNGQVSGYFHNTYLKGQQLNFVVIDRASNTSETVTISALLDNTPPAAISNIVLNEDGESFTAQAEAYSRVEVTDENGNTIGYGDTDSNGQVSGYFHNTYLKGQQLNFVVIDRASNTSETVTISALLDNTPPAAISNIVLNEDGESFTAQAEAYSRVEVTDENGNNIGYGDTDSNGQVSGYFYDTYLKGQQLNFVVIDRASNVSETVTISALLDNTPPAAISNIVLNEDGRNFTAQAEAYSRIEVTDENGNIIGYGNTNSDGQVSYGYFDSTYLKGQQLNFVVIDRAENTSSMVTISALIDNTPPNVATNLAINEWGELTGQAEPFATVKISYTSSDPYFSPYTDTVTVSADGTFYSYFDSNAESYSITVIDRANNQSSIITGSTYDLPKITIDDLHGSTGDDTYIVDHVSDHIQEYIADSELESDFGGYDKIFSSVSYSLVGYYKETANMGTLDIESGRYVEELELTGSANLNATGNASNNVLIGNTGDNILDGYRGNDTYTGNAGSDTVLYQLLDDTDATGGNGQDIWTDFHVGNLALDSEADKIDLSALLYNYDAGTTDALVDYIIVTQQGANTVISIDRDGTQSTFNSTELLVLNQVNTTLADLINNHQIII